MSVCVCVCVCVYAHVRVCLCVCVHVYHSVCLGVCIRLSPFKLHVRHIDFSWTTTIINFSLKMKKKKFKKTTLTFSRPSVLQRSV